MKQWMADNVYLVVGGFVVLAGLATVLIVWAQGRKFRTTPPKN